MTVNDNKWQMTANDSKLQQMTNESKLQMTANYNYSKWYYLLFNKREHSVSMEYLSNCRPPVAPDLPTASKYIIQPLGRISATADFQLQQTCQLPQPPLLHLHLLPDLLHLLLHLAQPQHHCPPDPLQHGHLLHLPPESRKPYFFLFIQFFLLFFGVETQNLTLRKQLSVRMSICMSVSPSVMFSNRPLTPNRLSYRNGTDLFGSVSTSRLQWCPLRWVWPQCNGHHWNRLIDMLQKRSVPFL